jgi:hypothetical protein
MKAVLLSVNFDTEDVIASWFDGENPMEKAGLLRGAVGDDFPGYVHHVYGDDEAIEASEDAHNAALLARIKELNEENYTD